MIIGIMVRITWLPSLGKTSRPCFLWYWERGFCKCGDGPLEMFFSFCILPHSFVRRYHLHTGRGCRTWTSPLSRSSSPPTSHPLLCTSAAPSCNLPHLVVCTLCHNRRRCTLSWPSQHSWSHLLLPCNEQLRHTCTCPQCRRPGSSIPQHLSKTICWSLFPCTSGPLHSLHLERAWSRYYRPSILLRKLNTDQVCHQYIFDRYYRVCHTFFPPRMSG